MPTSVPRGVKLTGLFVRLEAGSLLTWIPWADGIGKGSARQPLPGRGNHMLTFPGPERRLRQLAKMLAQSSEITLELTPRSRLDVIDVTQQIARQCNDFLIHYPKAFYFSYHTTAGYFEQSLCARLNHDANSLQAFVQSFQRLFPPNADYHHDQLDLRVELSEEQRSREPCNADSHLTFIGSGLTSSVTYRNCPNTPVYFIDLDGVCGDTSRQRQTTVVGFTREKVVDRASFLIPLSNHPIDSASLKDPRFRFFDQLQDLIARHNVAQGRIEISLAPDERHAGLTINEYETLLMKHDLAEVLHNPLRFMTEKGRHMLSDPRAIPTKIKDYAKYDLVQVVNEFVDTLGLRDSLLEQIIDKFLTVPAAHFLRMKRTVSLLISDPEGVGCGSIIQGNYQSPVLVQWRKAQQQERQLEVTLFRFE